MYRTTAPNVKWSTHTKLGPAKSNITPSSLHMPMCPIKGINQDNKGNGVHTMQQGNRALFGSIGPSMQVSLRVNSLSSAVSNSIALRCDDYIQLILQDKADFYLQLKIRSWAACQKRN